MVTQECEQRELWLQIIGSIAFDAVVSAIASSIFSLNLFDAILIFAGLQLTYAAAWLRKTLIAWVWWVIRGRRNLTERIIDSLESNRFPKPDTVIPSADSYLKEVAGNDRLDCKIRIAAISDFTVFQVVGSLGLFQTLLRLHWAYEAALETYYRSPEKAIMTRPDVE